MTGEDLFRAMEGISEEDLEHSERRVPKVVPFRRYGALAAAACLVVAIGAGAMRMRPANTAMTAAAQAAPAAAAAVAEPPRAMMAAAAPAAEPAAPMPEPAGAPAEAAAVLPASAPASFEAGGVLYVAVLKYDAAPETAAAQTECALEEETEAGQTPAVCSGLPLMQSAVGAAIVSPAMQNLAGKPVDDAVDAGTERAMDAEEPAEEALPELPEAVPGDELAVIGACEENPELVGSIVYQLESTPGDDRYCLLETEEGWVLFAAENMAG